MDKLDCFCVVLLENRSKKVIIPSSWVENVNKASNMNRGIKPHESYKIFYSADEKPPKFSLNVLENFSEADSCYNAFILKCFGKSFIILLFLFVQ